MCSAKRGRGPAMPLACARCAPSSTRRFGDPSPSRTTRRDAPEDPRPLARPGHRVRALLARRHALVQRHVAPPPRLAPGRARRARPPRRIQSVPKVGALAMDRPRRRRRHPKLLVLILSLVHILARHRRGVGRDRRRARRTARRWNRGRTTGARTRTRRGGTRRRRRRSAGHRCGHRAGPGAWSPRVHRRRAHGRRKDARFTRPSRSRRAGDRPRGSRGAAAARSVGSVAPRASRRRSTSATSSRARGRGSRRRQGVHRGRGAARREVLRGPRPV